MSQATAVAASARRNAAHGATLVVTGRREVARDVVELTLARPNGERLPDWAPGAHVDVVLPDGTTRQYSLLGDRWDAHSFTIAVLRERDGRGGSEYLHTRVGIGDAVGFGGPRNNFRLSPGAEYLFVAGGIGITPLIPMIRQAEMLETPWHLLYLGRSRERLAYREELAAYGDRVTIHTADERGRAVLDDWMPAADSAPLIYACGPERMLNAVDAWACSARPAPSASGALHRARRRRSSGHGVRGGGRELRRDRHGGARRIDRRGAAPGRRRRHHLVRPGRVRNVRDRRASWPAGPSRLAADGGRTGGIPLPLPLHLPVALRPAGPRSVIPEPEGTP